LRLPLDSLPKTSKNKREIVVDRSLFEDLPALDDYDEKKKTLWNYFETISSSKRVLSRRETEKNEEKTKPYLKLIHLLRQCIEERDGMLYVLLPTDYLEIT
jgi:hypothetical protein